MTVVFTSGTTGVPKGAMFGERKLAAVAQSTPVALGRARHCRRGDAVGHQLAHIGFMTKLPWYRRAMTLHLIDRWQAADVLRMIADERRPASAASPRGWRCCCAVPTSTTTTSRT